MATEERVVVVGPGIRVIVRDDAPPGQVFIVDAALLAETNADGTPKYPLSVARIANV